MSVGVGGDAGNNTPFRAGSYEIAGLAAGAAITAVDAVLKGRVDKSMRWCGRQDTTRRLQAAMGSAYSVTVRLRNVTRSMIRESRALRLSTGMYIMGQRNPGCLLCGAGGTDISLYQDNEYRTGRGSRSENGIGRGQGAALNVPLPPASASEPAFTHSRKSLSPHFVFISRTSSSSLAASMPALTIHWDR